MSISKITVRHFVWTLAKRIRYETFDLNSGRQVYSGSFNGPIVGAGESAIITPVDAALERFRLTRWDRQPLEESMLEFSLPYASLSKGTWPRVVNGFIVRTERGPEGDSIVVLDPANGQELVNLSLEGMTAKSIYGAFRHNFFEVRGFVDSGDGTAIPTQKLFQIESGKIKPVAERGSDFLGWITLEHEGEVHVATLSTDGQYVEIRSVNNNSLVNSIPIPTSTLSTAPITPNQIYTQQTWITFGTQVPELHVDPLTGERLLVPDGWRLFGRNRNLQRSVVRSPDAEQVQLTHEPTGKAIRAISLNGNCIQAGFVRDGQWLTIVGDNQHLLLLDSITGKLLHEIDPLRNILYLDIVTALAFFIWSYAYLKVAAAVHRHAWLDCAIVSLPCIGYVIFRAQMTGFTDDVSRPIFQLAEGIFVSWLTMTSLWLVLGKARISLRILPEILIITAVILTTLLCVGFDNPRVWELIIAVGLACIWLNVACLPLRFMGYRGLVPIDDCLGWTSSSRSTRSG